MQAPLRLLRAFRTGTHIGIVMATAVATAVFAATPLTLPAVAERFSVGAGTAGLYSAAQLGAFVIGSWSAGRFLTPTGRVFRLALSVLAAANLVSALTDVFALLVVVRGAAGLALGTLTWLAWSQVFGDNERQGDIAVVGPLAGVVASPLLGLLLWAGDDRHVFVALAVLALVPMAWTPEFAAPRARAATPRHRPVRAAFILVVALGLLTFGGSAVFVFGGVIAIDKLAMDPFTVSLAFSVNAAASIPSARWRGERRGAGLWMVVTATCAVGLGLINDAWMLWPVLALWGFAFWAGIPGIYTLLADRSAYPAERAGDAQAAMAAGRAVGPLVGGLVVNVSSFTWLGVMGGAVMAVGGLTCLAVESRP